MSLAPSEIKPKEGLRRFLICSANHASQAGWSRSSSHSSILFSSASWPESNAMTSSLNVGRGPCGLATLNLSIGKLQKSKENFKFGRHVLITLSHR